MRANQANVPDLLNRHKDKLYVNGILAQRGCDGGVERVVQLEDKRRRLEEAVVVAVVETRPHEEFLLRLERQIVTVSVSLGETAQGFHLVESSVVRQGKKLDVAGLDELLIGFPMPIRRIIYRFDRCPTVNA